MKTNPLQRRGIALRGGIALVVLGLVIVGIGTIRYQAEPSWTRREGLFPSKIKWMS